MLKEQGQKLGTTSLSWSELELKDLLAWACFPG
jgi:hypothetical protein